VQEGKGKGEDKSGGNKYEEGRETGRRRQEKREKSERWRGSEQHEKEPEPGEGRSVARQETEGTGE